MNYQKVKGTQDFYGNNAKKFRFLETITKEVAKNYGFEEIVTPIFENTEVFTRSVGDESDIVTKEMYTFLDKGKRSITLRPEGTAAVARSLLENKLYANNKVTKLFYFGPMFRYERPQAGRFRQFHQFGIEAFGPSNPLLDADIIMSAYTIFKKLGIQNIKLKINSIGDFKSRSNYAISLQEYFKDNIHELCGDCNRRLEKNPMRILDCKVDRDNPVLLNAPNISDYLNDESKNYFKEVLAVLDDFEIPYEVDHNLVRGLDYYTDTVFEYIIDSDDDLNGLAICAGGKYSDLIKSMGGPDIPGIGYAFGVERILAIMDKQDKFNLDEDTSIVVMALDPISKKYSLKLTNLLRNNGFYTELDYNNITMKQQFKLAERLNARYIIIIGEEERLTNKLTIKDTVLGTQNTIEKENIIEFLSQGVNQKYENA